MSNQATPEQLAARTTAQQLAEAWYAATSQFSKLSSQGGKVFDGIAEAFNAALAVGWPELDADMRWEVRKLVMDHGALEVLSVNGKPTTIEGPEDHFTSYGIRNYVAYVKAENLEMVRSDFVEDLCEALSKLIQAGATEDQIRADFEAQLSLQRFDVD